MNTPEDGFDKNPPRLTGAKRQHYLPRMYLQGFEANGGLAVYDRKTGDIRLQTAHNTALTGHLYTFEDEAGRKRYELEELLSDIESKMAISIPRLLTGSFDGGDVETLICFIALMEIRTPSALEATKQIKAKFVNTTMQAMTRTPERARHALSAMYRHSGTVRTEDELAEEARRMMEFVQGGHYDIQVDDQFALMQNFKLWEVIYKALKEKNILLVRPRDPRSRYITCDSPVILESVSGNPNIGFGSPDAKIMFPLTAECAVAFEGKGSRMGQASASAVNVARINEILVRSAQRYAISSDEQQLRILTQRLNLHGTLPHPRHVTGTIFINKGAVGYTRRVPPHRLPPR